LKNNGISTTYLNWLAGFQPSTCHVSYPSKARCRLALGDSADDPVSYDPDYHPPAQKLRNGHPKKGVHVLIGNT